MNSASQNSNSSPFAALRKTATRCLASSSCILLLALAIGSCNEDQDVAQSKSKAETQSKTTAEPNTEDQSGSGQVNGSIRVVEPPPSNDQKSTAPIDAQRDWPIRGKIVIRAISGCSNLNPLTASLPVNVKAIGYQLNFGLITPDPDRIRPQPWLAESMPELDGKAQVWTLRKGATWSDGKALTSADAVHSWKLLNLPALQKGAAARVWAGMSGSEIETIETLDERRFRVVYKKPATNINAVVFGLGFPIVPQHIVPLDAEKAAALRQMPGSGPYTVEKWEPKTSITFKRLEDWWGDRGHAVFKNKFRLNRVVRKVVTDNIQVEEQLINGLLDLAAVNSVDAYMRLEGEPWDTQFDKAHYYLSKWSFIGWNCQNPLFKDARVRRALSRLIARYDINKKRYHGLSNQISGPFFSESDFCDSAIRPLRFSNRKALKLLAEAGWKDRDQDGLLDRDGRAFKFTMLCRNVGNGWAKAVLESFAETLRQAGIDMSVEYLTGKVMFDRLGKHQNDAYILIWDLDALNPDLYSMMHSSQAKGGWNWQNFLNAELDQLLVNFRKSGDAKQRVTLAHKIHRLLHREQPISFLFTNPSCIVWNRRIKNVQTHALGLRVWDLRVED